MLSLDSAHLHIVTVECGWTNCTCHKALLRHEFLKMQMRLLDETVCVCVRACVPLKKIEKYQLMFIMLSSHRYKQ